MTTDEPCAEKHIVDELDFTPNTAKRVSWESWEFTVVGPHLVEVTNASYGYLKDEHRYTVGVVERDGLLVPSECNCPADIHSNQDCKHKLALAAVGGEIVLQAAVEYSATIDNRTISDNPNRCGNGTAGCCGPDGNDLPCFACYTVSEEMEA